RPPSQPVRTRVLSTAPATLTQPALDVSHRSHWYWKLVGLFCQLPFCAVRVSPCRGVPLIVGGLVFTGAAALACAANIAKAPKMAARNISTRIVETFAFISLPPDVADMTARARLPAQRIPA